MASTKDRMQKEIDDAQNHLQRIGASETMELKERAVLYKDFFEFLYESKYLLEYPTFRKAVKGKITEIFSKNYGEDVMDVVRVALKNICKKLQTYEPKDAPIIEGCDAPALATRTSKKGVAAAVAAAGIEEPPLPKAAAPPPSPKNTKGSSSSNTPTKLPEKVYEILGSGGYGAVFHPALPNITDDGILKNFPGNVTKAFYYKHTLQDAINAASEVGDLMGKNEGHRFNTYKKKYKGKNLPDALFQGLKSIHPSLKRSDDLHLMRLPYVGIDIYHLINDKKRSYREMRKVPIGIVLEQILKLIRQTAGLASKEYLHADVRETNILVNPSTGVFTLVDFDWLKPFEIIYDEYPFPFYNNPPECILKKHFSEIRKEKDITLELIEGITDKSDLIKYTELILRSYSTTLIQKNIDNINSLIKAVQENNVLNAKYMKSQSDKYNNKRLGYSSIEEKVFLKDIFPTFDNFGLSFSLLEMMAFVYPGSIKNPTERTPEFERDLITYLSSILKKGDGVYTEKEMKANVEALLALSRLLHTMSSFNLESRPTAADALKEMEKIVAAYRRKLPSTGGSPKNHTRKNRGSK